MFKTVFRRCARLLGRVPLITTLIIPVWILQKKFRFDDVFIQSTLLQTQPKPQLEIEYSETLPEKIAQCDDKNVIVYFMSGNQEEDELVKRLLINYRNNHNQNIHAFFIKPSIDPSGVGLHHIFLTKRNYSKDINKISFKSELDKLSPEEFINVVIKRLEKYIHKIPEINQSTLESISNTKLPKVILKCDKNSPDYKKHRILFQNFMEKPFTFKKIEFMIVTDEEAAKTLGLDSAAEGSIHMLVPSENELLKNEASTDFLRIGNHQFAIVREITNDKSLKQNFIFMPFVNHTFDYILELKLNSNRITKEEKEELFEICRKLSHPIHITYSNIPKKFELLYSQHDDLSYKILKQELPNMNVEQKVAHLTTPKQWLYKGLFAKEQIEEWIEHIKKREIEPYFKSEPTPKIDMYSHKLTGKNFQEILVSTDNQVVFFYSNSCHNCAMFGQLYEQIARSNFSDDKLVLNHIEIEHNEMECGYNTPLTPTLSFFKLQSKTKPFNYDLKSLNKEAINNFINITKEVKLVDDDLFNKYMEGRVGYNYQL